MLNIAEWKKCSLVDFPGKIATIVFSQGCNFRCPFCHNEQLFSPNVTNCDQEENIFSFLKMRKGKIDGVVISGGEPTMQIHLVDFIKKVKDLGLLVKLDTNGSLPHVVKSLLENELIDFIAMDLKHSQRDYTLACGVQFPFETIKNTMDILRKSEIDYEIRTTLIPTIHELNKLDEFIPLVSGVKRFTIQNFNPKFAAQKKLRNLSPFTEAELENLRPIFEPIVEKFTIRY